MSETAIAILTAKLSLPEEEPVDKPKRKPIPDHIPHIEVELTPSTSDCAQCAGKLRRLGEDVTEELEYIPGRFILNRFVRPRMACSGCDCCTQAPLPTRPIKRGRPGPGLLAHVLVNKYADHLPLYRQSQIFDHEELNLGRSTLADWVGKSTALLETLAAAIGRHVLAGQAIFADDTPVAMLAPGTILPPVGISSRPTATGSTQRSFCRNTPAGCTLTAMPDSKTCITQARYARSPASPMSAASSSMSTRRKDQPSLSVRARRIG